MNNVDIIKKATEAYERNVGTGRYVGDLLNIIKQQQTEIDRLTKIIINAQADIENIVKMNFR